jgi:membrane protein required for beta-lactamase induction
MAESALQQAKKRAEVLALERRARVEAWSDYLGFVAVKLVGVACVLAGTVAVVLPHLLTMPKPSAVAGGGVALLVTNKTIINVLTRVMDTLRS